MPIKKQLLPNTSKKYIIILVVAVSIVNLLLFIQSVKNIRDNYYEVGVSVSEKLFESIVVTRKWNSIQGGVYVPVTDELQPNPYLVDPLRDVETKNNLQLTKINPAFMTRLISQLMEDESETSFKITSLKPLNPDNEPDSWERESLLLFEQEVTDSHELFTHEDSSTHLRYMAPLITESSCLSCHAQQGYKEGDIRGGISTSIPFNHFQLAITKDIRNNIMTHGIALTISLGIILYFGFQNIKQERSLQEAKRAAEEANRTKSEFLANMSHEIRTPMNVIMGMTEIVYNSELKEEQKEYLGMVRDSTASLLTIINDILDFSKIEAGRLELEAEDFNLYEKVEQTTASFALQAQQKGLELLLFIQPDVPQTVRGDPARLRQILVNLLGNAFKFTDEGEIILSLSKEHAGPGGIQDTAAPAQTGSDALQPKQGPSSEVLVFSIQDTGIGIPRNKQALLFQSFSQVDASSTRRHEGTGLGLAISQKLVELMGGSIGVESEPDRGSTFTFRVPLCLPVAAAAEELPAIPEHFPDVHVLVIDDNRANQLIIKEMLESRGLTVQAAPGGREGLEIMRHHATKDEPFDLVFLDQQMPGMDGLQVAEQINREKLLQGPTLIMLSSVDSNVNAARRGALGLFSYLVKPVKPSELFSHIHAALCRTKQQMPLREGEAPVKAAEADQAEQPEAVQGTKLQILLVEDKPMNRKLATTLLNKKGWSVTEAHNGRQALEMLATSSFDLVLMDIQMPEMDGIEATKHIRNQEKTTGTRIPIIAMTAHAMQGDREQFMAAGMDGYVSKPINAEELYRVVEEAAAAIKAEGALEAAADSTSPPSQESEKPADPEAVDLADTGEVEYISREVSSMLKTLGGDKELLAEMVALLLDDAPKDLERLRELLARRDGENATLVAHGLKGQLGNLSLEMGHNTAHSLEKTLFEGQFVEALTCLETLEKELKLLERFFARPDWREML